MRPTPEDIIADAIAANLNPADDSWLDELASAIEPALRRRGYRVTYVGEPAALSAARKRVRQAARKVKLGQDIAERFFEHMLTAPGLGEAEKIDVAVDLTLRRTEQVAALVDAAWVANEN